MTPRACDFSPDQGRPGWSRCTIPGGELCAETDSLGELERLGLLDPERWRARQLGGVTLRSTTGHWVRTIPGERRTLVARYRRRRRHGQWLERILRVRTDDPGSARLERAGHVILVGRVDLEEGLRESLLVSDEAVVVQPLSETAWRRRAAELRPMPGAG